MTLPTTEKDWESFRELANALDLAQVWLPVDRIRQNNRKHGWMTSYYLELGDVTEYINELLRKAGSLEQEPSGDCLVFNVPTNTVQRINCNNLVASICIKKYKGKFF